MSPKIKFEVGSGNIFADIGLTDAETHFLKALIVAEIYRLTKERKLTQTAAGKRMGSPSRRSRACSKAASGSIPSTG